jgi:hypothetical protein
MNDTEILDDVVRILDNGLWTDCKRNRQELISRIKQQRAEEELTQKIRKEVTYQLRCDNPGACINPKHLYLKERK